MTIFVLWYVAKSVLMYCMNCDLCVLFVFLCVDGIFDELWFGDKIEWQNSKLSIGLIGTIY